MMKHSKIFDILCTVYNVHSTTKLLDTKLARFSTHDKGTSLLSSCIPVCMDACLLACLHSCFSAVMLSCLHIHTCTLALHALMHNLLNFILFQNQCRHSACMISCFLGYMIYLSFCLSHSTILSVQ